MLITSIHPSGKPFFLLSLFSRLETALVYDPAIFGVYAIAIWHVSATGKPSTPSRRTHPHPSKSAVALPPLSSPAATAQLSDICLPLLELQLDGILLIPSGLSYSESLFCHLQLLLYISKVCSSSHSVGENVNWRSRYGNQQGGVSKSSTQTTHMIQMDNS